MYVLIGGIILNKWISEVIKNINNETYKKICNKLYRIIPIVTVILVLGGCSYLIYQKRNDTFINEADYPVEACNWIIENIDLDSMRIFNEYNYGSYMLYRGIPVFIDARCDLYTKEFNQNVNIFNDFIDTSSLNVFYENIFEKYDITHIILYKNAKVNMIINHTDNMKYNCLYEDDYFVLYERKV